jgi:pepsin A
MSPSFVNTLLSLLLIGVASASPLLERDTPAVTLQFAHHVNSLNGTKNLAQIDRARAKALVDNVTGAKGNVVSVGINNAVVTYTTQVGIGSPPTKYTLLIDTGSSNTWVGANKPYVKTSTSKDTGGTVSVTYGSGSFSGEEFKDTVTIAPKLVIKTQSIGVASQSQGFNTVDGILGIGPKDLTAGTVSNQNIVNTVTDNLFKNGKIPKNELGIFFRPATSGGGKGEMTWGGIDTTKIVGSVNYVPVTTTQPASFYWGISQTIKYGSQTILPNTQGIVDTGTTLVLLASDAFAKYETATGATPDGATGLLKITAAQYSQLKNLNFKIGTQTYSLTPNAQIWPRSLNTQIGGTAGSIYLIVGDLGSPSGQGLDFIDGYAFLERFYSVYDTTNKRVGFAKTKYTKATTN